MTNFLFLFNALGEIGDERQTLRDHLHHLDLWQQQTAAHQAHLNQPQHLATAKTRLSDATPLEQRRIYELLQLRIHVTPDRTLDIQGSIPTHPTLQPQHTPGEVSEGAPQHP